MERNNDYRFLFHTSDGRPYVGHFADDGRTRVYVREATPSDYESLYSGLSNDRGEWIKYDGATDPSALAWDAHVRAGGD